MTKASESEFMSWKRDASRGPPEDRWAHLRRAVALLRVSLLRPCRGISVSGWRSEDLRGLGERAETPTLRGERMRDEDTRYCPGSDDTAEAHGIADHRLRATFGWSTGATRYAGQDVVGSEHARVKDALDRGRV